MLRNIIKNFFITSIYTALSFTTVFAQGTIDEIGKDYFILNLDFPKAKFSEVEYTGIKIRDYFEYTDESKSGMFKLPNKRIILAVPPDSHPIFSIIDKNSNIITSTIPALNPIIEKSNAGDINYKKAEYLNSNLNKSNLDIIEVKGFFWLRDYYCVELKINNYLFNENLRQIEEINNIQLKVSFRDLLLNHEKSSESLGYDELLNYIICNYEFAQKFLNKELRPKTRLIEESNAQNYDWIDFNSEYLKIGLAEDGIHRLYKSDLESNQVPISNINPQTFKLYKRGVEIPIYVQGELDGSFDDTDYIEFFSEKNYGQVSSRIINDSEEPYNEYIDRYSDTTICWLTWGNDNGIRIDTTNFNVTSTQDTLYDYLETLHFEQNNFLDYLSRNLVIQQNPEWNENKTWFWGLQGVGNGYYNFSLSDIVPNKKALVYFKVISFASNILTSAHKVGLMINSDGTVYDSLPFNKYEQKLLTAEINSNILSEGNNTLTLISFPTNANPNSVAVDWYEIEFSRYLKLVNNSLKFKFETPPANVLRSIKISNADTINFILYKYSNKMRRLNNFTFKNGNIAFNDSVLDDDKYFITDEGNIRKPVIYYKKKFTNLVSSNEQADYILLTHPEFISTASNYLSFIQNSYNVIPKLINVYDIYDQFNYGFFSPEPIKEFLKQAYTNWQAPKPSYLFIVGEANYDYHNYKQITNFTKNFVPSYGFPVSDNWFVIWDSVSVIPQMYIGRLAAHSNEEFQHYFNKHRQYLDERYNQWNKSYLLFSGGKDQSEQQSCKSVNDALINQLILPPPIGGYVGQLYTTSNPPSNFGPFPETYVDSLLFAGGIIISYIGHSGTKIWDNGIEEVTQLKNKYNRTSLITDYGCSTGKFAEPDIISFSEAFTNGLDGDAIGYIGNSSLGFTSTSYGFPQIFYSEIYKNNVLKVSEAHLKGKINLINNNGLSDVNKVFVLTNTLFMDPIIELKIPPKPNLLIENENVKLPNFLDDNLDSIYIDVDYYNLGRVDTNSFSILINDYLNGNLIFSTSILKSLPLNSDKFTFSVPVKNLAGVHSVEIMLDDLNQVDELYEDDNKVIINYTVLTSSIRTLIDNPLRTSCNGNFTILNSVKPSGSDTLILELSSNQWFDNPIIYGEKFDTLITKIKLNNLDEGKRYWFRIGMESNPSIFFETVSFVVDSSGTFYYSISDSSGLQGIVSKNIVYSDSGFTLNKSEQKLILSSAGFEADGIAKIEFNGTDYTNNPLGCGFHNVVFNEADMKFEEYRWFNFWNEPNNYAAYAAWLNSVPEGKVLAVSLGGECGGYNVSEDVKNGLHQFGSDLIDSVEWGSSFVLLGKKNAVSGSVHEAFSKTSIVEYDSSSFIPNSYGKLVTNSIMTSGKWNYLRLVHSVIPDSSSIRVKPIVFNLEPDTLSELNFQNDIADLSHLNLFQNKTTEFLIELEAGVNGVSPRFDALKMNFNLLAELGTNYQVVEISKDSVQQGENVSLSFYVYNIGESLADSFNVLVEIINPDNSSKKIFDEVTSLGLNQRKLFNVPYNTSNDKGFKYFYISIDTENKITELYKDNNFYTIPFYVIPDTTITSVSEISINVVFDGVEILDGDYVSSNPDISIILNYPVWFPTEDTAAVEFYLNQNQVYYSQLLIQHDTSNKRIIYQYLPNLSDGDYTLRVFGINVNGKIEDSPGFQKHFLVTNEVKLLDIFNYPNPVTENTYFTFRLTQIPDNIKILVYTIAGRLVKEIVKSSAELKTDFNKIFWDTRDEDSDLLGNGTYLYKVIMTSANKIETSVNKLAIVR